MGEATSDPGIGRVGRTGPPRVSAEAARAPEAAFAGGPGRRGPGQAGRSKREGLYRGVFVLGLGLTALSFITGLLTAWRYRGTLPGLDQSPFAEAARAQVAGDRAAAVREWRSAARLQGASLEATLRAAEHFAWLGDLQAAGRLLESARRRAPGAAELSVSFGWVLLHQRRLEEAEEHLRAATQALPRDAHAWAGLGEVHLGRGRYEEAIDAFRRSLWLAPGRAHVHNSLGIALAGSGRPERAIDAFETAVALAPSAGYQANLERARSAALGGREEDGSS